jgi:type VI secretion system protein ImpA
MIDIDLLVKPISDDKPCGSDLELDGDVGYLNFFASAESLLPKSYFEATDAEGNKKRFDPNSINFDAELQKAQPLLARTRDLRLVVFLAKIAILSRDLASFTRCLEAIAVLLDRYWREVHPRAEDGDVSYRQSAIEALDVLPTVILPLQFHPLLSHRRYGLISYRSCLIARGEIPPREDDVVLDRVSLEQIFHQVDVEQLKTSAENAAALAAAVKRVETVWNQKSDSGVLNLDRLSALADSMAALLGDVIKRRDPAATTAPKAELEAEDAKAPSGGESGSARTVASVADAAAALEGVAAYFRQSEPSSPALLLVLQAQQMLGKSFVEALRILLPTHAETATIHIGRDSVFNLSIERMAALLDNGPGSEPVVSEAAVVNPAATRAEALAWLEQVGAFFRRVEPSSPVPYLTDRARDLAQRDFLTLLRAVLPEGTLKTPDNQS